MGDRYMVPVRCPKCGANDTAYYAPAYGFIDWRCSCGSLISHEDASNRKGIDAIVRACRHCGGSLAGRSSKTRVCLSSHCCAAERKAIVSRRKEKEKNANRSSKVS